MRRQLVLVVGFALAAVLVAFLPAPVWLRSSLLIPLVLALPGFAIAAALFPPRTVGVAERAVYVVVLSVVVAATTGVLTQVLFDLSRDLWAALLAAVTVGAALRAIFETPEATDPMQVALPRRLPVSTAAFVVAALVAALAIDSATHGLHDAEAKIHFTDFWLLPSTNPVEGSGGDRLQVGLRSYEGSPTRYQLRISIGGRTLVRKDIELSNGEQWERSLSLGEATPGATVIAALIRADERYRVLDFSVPR
jgi:uncharacterized membrane protein